MQFYLITAICQCVVYFYDFRIKNSIIFDPYFLNCLFWFGMKKFTIFLSIFFWTVLILDQKIHEFLNRLFWSWDKNSRIFDLYFCFDRKILAIQKKAVQNYVFSNTYDPWLKWWKRTKWKLNCIRFGASWTISSGSTDTRNDDSNCFRSNEICNVSTFNF